MKIDERHLIQLAAVVKTGGVTEGAALLGLAQVVAQAFAAGDADKNQSVSKAELTTFLTPKTQ